MSYVMNCKYLVTIKQIPQNLDSNLDRPITKIYRYLPLYGDGRLVEVKIGCRAIEVCITIGKDSTIRCN